MTDDGGSTRWLTDEEQRAWRAFLALDQQLFAHLARSLQRDSDLSAADYEVLVQLSEAPDDQRRVFELSDELQWEKSRLSHQLTRMQRRGLVERHACATDGRGAHIRLTPHGRAAIEAAAPAHVAELRAVFIDVLTEAQLRQLEQLAATVLAALAARTAGDDAPT